MIVKEVRKHRNNDKYVVVTKCGHIIYVSLNYPPRFINEGTEIEVLRRGRFNYLAIIKPL